MHAPVGYKHFAASPYIWVMLKAVCGFGWGNLFAEQPLNRDACGPCPLQLVIVIFFPSDLNKFGHRCLTSQWGQREALWHLSYQVKTDFELVQLLLFPSKDFGKYNFGRQRYLLRIVASSFQRGCRIGWNWASRHAHFSHLLAFLKYWQVLACSIQENQQAII